MGLFLNLSETKFTSSRISKGKTYKRRFLKLTMKQVLNGNSFVVIIKWGGTGGREPGRKGAGGERREGGKRKSKGGRNREKLRKISQHFVIFCNTNGTKRRDPLRKGAGSGSRRYGKREIQTPLSPPTIKRRLGDMVAQGLVHWIISDLGLITGQVNCTYISRARHFTPIVFLIVVPANC